MREHIARVARVLRQRSYSNVYTKAYILWKKCELEGWFCFPPHPRKVEA